MSLGRKLFMQEKKNLSTHSWDIPQTCRKSTSGIVMYKLYREPFEGMPIRYGSPDGLLKLFVTGRYTRGSFQLVGGQRWGQEVAEFIVP